MSAAPSPTVDDVRCLAESVHTSAALDNDFYRLWMSTPLTSDQVQLFAVNFHAHVAPTVDRIAETFIRLDDTAARAETLENMFDEMGHGDPTRVHAVIAERWLDSLLTAVHGTPMRLADSPAPILPTTQELIDNGRALFASDAHTSLGALLAQEWHAYPQLVNLYEGVRLYMDKYPGLDTFHENCEFFYLHIGAAEKEHKLQSLASVARVCHTPEAFTVMRTGFEKYLDLLARYWNGLHTALVHPEASAVDTRRCGAA